MKFRIVSAVFIASFLVFILTKVNFWWWILAGFIFIGLISWGSFDIRQNFFVKSFSNKKNSTKKEIALTFDDGPAEFTPDFLDLLKKFGAKATFFCIGKQIEKHPEIFRQIIAEGHEIGNHTYSHSNWNGFFSTKKIISEIEKTDAVIKLEGGIKSELFRPPFGVTNPNIAKAIKILNKKSIGWNVRSLDTVLKNEAEISARILKKVKPGSIILMHDTSEKSLLALHDLLLNLQKQNYRFVTVNQLLTEDFS